MNTLTETESPSTGNPPPSPLEVATQHWNRAQAALSKYPEARRFLDYRKKWSKHNERLRRLETLADEATAKERLMWQHLEKMKAALPDEARDALC